MKVTKLTTAYFAFFLKALKCLRNRSSTIPHEILKPMLGLCIQGSSNREFKGIRVFLVTEDERRPASLIPTTITGNLIRSILNVASIIKVSLLGIWDSNLLVVKNTFTSWPSSSLWISDRYANIRSGLLASSPEFSSTHCFNWPMVRSFFSLLASRVLKLYHWDSVITIPFSPSFKTACSPLQYLHSSSSKYLKTRCLENRRGFEWSCSSPSFRKTSICVLSE